MLLNRRLTSRVVFNSGASRTSPKGEEREKKSARPTEQADTKGEPRSSADNLTVMMPQSHSRVVIFEREITSL